MSPAIVKQIASMLFDGFNDDDIAFYVGFSVKTITSLRRGEAFPEVRIGLMARKQKLIAKLRDGNTKNWMRIAWWLERRYPQEFAKPEVQLTIGASSITNNSIVITAEAAGQLAARAKPVNEAVRKLVDEHRPVNGDVSQVTDK